MAGQCRCCTPRQVPRVEVHHSLIAAALSMSPGSSPERWRYTLSAFWRQPHGSGHVKLEHICIHKDHGISHEVARFYLILKSSFECVVHADVSPENQPHKATVREMLSLEDGSAIVHGAPDLPPIENLVLILQKCRRTRNLAEAKYAHALVCNNGLETHTTIGNHIVPMFVECKSMSHAQQVFEKSLHVNEFSWTSLISGISECGQLQQALALYHKMQEDTVSPSCHTLVALLKACARTRDLERGQEIHLEVTELGFERDIFIGSALIDVYAKCGSLFEAQEVLDEMPERGAVAWTTLMAGYVEHGPCQEALKCFEWMQMEGFVADDFSFACSLKACGIIGCIKKGRELHRELTSKGLERDLFVGSSLVAMYAKCGSLSEAQEVFDKLPVRDVVLWNTLLTGYAEHGPGQDAVKCFEQMQVEGIFPDAVTLACTLKCCGDIGAIDKGREIHMEIRQQRLECHPHVANSLISLYTKCGLHLEAQKVFDKLPARDVVSWTALIAGYVDYGSGLEALEYYKQMKLEDVSPDAFTLACTLKACSSIGATDMCHELHMEVVEKGFERDLFVVSTLVCAYAKCACLVEALEIFDKLPERDVVSWNALIAGYAEHGPGQEVFECLEMMQLEGITLDAVTYACSLKACGNLGAMEKGKELYMEITCKGFDSDISIGGTLISMYARCGSLSEAREVFDKLPFRSAVSWSLMIKGYAMNHEGSMVIECFEDMQKEGVKPDSVILTCLLTACSHTSMVSEGQKYFNLMREEYGIEPTKEHYTCMVDLLCRSGHLYEAEKFLDIIPSLSEGTWAAVLSACKTYVEADLGWRCLQQLVQKSPEDATWYVVMADIYASAGRSDDACRLEELRKHAGAKKKPASALIEVNKKVHKFVVSNNQSMEISAMLRTLSSRAKLEGYLPNLELDLKPHSDEMKDEALCEHAEKLAIAFGLLNTQQGETLRVTKNLRMCSDCHNASKIISKLEKREIILRDDCCVHHFKEGLCSCGDMF